MMTNKMNRTKITPVEVKPPTPQPALPTNSPIEMTSFL